MSNYYNEHDPYAAQWLRNLIKAGHIGAGDVDERSIVDVRAEDLRSYTQCHFFAGIGGWSLALRLAGWSDDRPVWTGSCPCQPFSAAGAGKAADDERHLWPAWFPLIAECKPAIVFGEQVEAAVGWGWLDAVFADLEGEGYACGATVLPACGVGAPHIRQRLWFVADASEPRRQAARQYDGGQSQLPARPAEHGGTGIMANTVRSGAGATPGRGFREEAETVGKHRHLSGGSSGVRIHSPARVLADTDGRDAETERLQRSREHGQRTQGSGSSELADSDSARRGPGRPGEASGGRDAPRLELAGLRAPGELADAAGGGQRELGDAAQPRRGRYDDGGGVLNGFWSDAEWIACTDGKARPVGPGSFPLGHGIQRRASKLRAYGNAIVPQVAAEFIMATCGGGMMP